MGKMVFKQMLGMAMFPFFMDYFEYVSHEYSTRNNNKLLRLPKINLESSKKLFFYNGAKVYNTLPNHIRAVENKHEFLKILEKLLWNWFYVMNLYI